MWMEKEWNHGLSASFKLCLGHQGHAKSDQGVPIDPDKVVRLFYSFLEFFHACNTLECDPFDSKSGMNFMNKFF